MSTFSGLNTAYTGLVAAKAGLDVVGQNLVNANTQGYTRQRVTTSGVPALSSAGLFSGGVRPGQGVTIDGIQRLDDAALDARVRTTTALSGYTNTRADALATLEQSLNEPGTNGLSAQLQKFWSAWGDVANQAGEQAPAGVLLGQAGSLVTQLQTGYRSVDDQWTTLRASMDGMASDLNTAATAVADLNGRIRSALASGQSANELLDRRDLLTASIAKLAGGVVRPNDDGTVDVLVGGNALVSGTSTNLVKAAGASRMADAAADPARLEWAYRPGAAIALEGGSIAGAVSTLAPADASGTGGVLAEAAVSYNAFAVTLAQRVNAVHSTGATPTGATGLDFFAIDPTKPAALGLSVVPTGVGQIATGTPGAGGTDGSIADAISQLGTGANAVDKQWSSFVVRVGVASRTEKQQSDLADLASSAATNAQLAGSSVDLDEENMNMLSFQHAYQGAARVMTAVDEALDVLINHTGLVGR
ncbi:flagellar hook-associated protein 1 FlgK [Leifsonia sp. 98AMF]|jgi:flagellar hook-associated protein 1 FlgK|uniref:flagellar hook-associated protein FlgK n=1 Tax=unclassified Leifsonia TaxID=2663824 RepID=UPI000879A9D2|nr:MULTISPECIES: flagellar hook-associated protein FlgK [unclassified Leifsonia]SDG97277.1 flagellar hook-associated protein 1 FlgK [Leifsonia sp. 197AMF]SDJ44199.1 flagellar hook-associated protein 1 FlgK [Leifsonia sp. 466MF]SDK32152.1 flagellar hook-associated protein 1 FlgK [Leifsonia sp. 157MF]SDN64533.1 flagellar hook-associated protein 1 FlgK [Leifsonia sp. 509MF]SEN44246.1 flagellar hook-associated protein 1 FlgK [Leifsonia sp. 467MF]